MKIIVYGINYFPELTGIGKYTGEMGEWMGLQGHEVRVVTAPPYYPSWKVAAPYNQWKYLVEDVSPGVTVWRSPLWVPSKVSGINRLFHLASFAFLSIPTLFRQIGWRADVILVVVPALMCAPAAWLVARLAGAQAAIHIQDFEVDAAFELGLLKSPFARRLALACERWLLRRFDRVSTISPRMLALARAKGVAAEKLLLFPNWVDLAAVPMQAAEAPGPQAYRAELGIPAGAVVALYSGNLGTKQGLEILPEVARRMAASHPAVVFVFCGQGVGRAAFEAACAGLANVRLLPLQPAGRLADLLAMADIHLLPQRADAADLVMPSKLTGMLASGRAVVATAHPGTGVAEVVSACGLVVPPEDAEALAGAIARLADHPGMRIECGQSARKYAEEHLDRSVVLRRYEAELMQACGIVSGEMGRAPAA